MERWRVRGLEGWHINRVTENDCDAVILGVIEQTNIFMH